MSARSDSLTLGFAALAALSALATTGCDQTNQATPEPGRGAAGTVAADSSAAPASATPNQTPEYGQPGAAPGEVRSSPGHPQSTTRPSEPPTAP
jgi:hypothetical protein